MSDLNDLPFHQRHDSDVEGVNPTIETGNRPMSAIIDAALTRRQALAGLAATAAAGTVLGSFAPKAEAAGMKGESSLTFTETMHAIRENHHVAPGYKANVLIRWGDKVAKDAPAFDIAKQSAEAQEKQFGYNNDFIGYMPLPAGSKNSEHGLLVVNHEYTNPELMFSGLTAEDAMDKVTKEQVEVELAAHGLSVIEVKKVKGAWQVVENSPYARRISMRSTAMDITGPAAGHDRLKTKADPTGRKVIGTLNNCAGGKTPWGTVLSAEENFHQYFAGEPAGPEADSHKRVGIKNKPEYAWGKYVERMDVTKEPNEPNRFGWLVEVDPYDPTSTPKKRTALGRFKHEAASVAINPGGRVTVYTGDDERFEYLYRFVSMGTYDPKNRKANMDLLDDGVLYVAKFHDDGRLEWLPLIQGNGVLNAANGFKTQADVLIEARRAADLMGATPMDRPEDVEVNPVTGRVYMACTNNTSRKAEQVNKANPRAENAFGHIIEIVPPGKDGARDHAAMEYSWNIFLLAGNPEKPEHGAKYHAAVTSNGWLAAPDNVAFDKKGRLWISTDQGSAQAKNMIPDGMYATDTDGPGRALTKFFYACPRDAEMCGPEFTPDGKTLFVAVQHPGEGKKSTFKDPSTRFPDFKPGMPPRPSVVVITKEDGGEIGA